MIKIKHKELAQILNLSEKYIKTLLFRRGIKLKQVDMVKIIDLIVEYKKKHRYQDKITGSDI